jgi:hypothetical protein
MTDVCRFDFNSVWVVAFDRSGAATLTDNGDRTADRGSANDCLSHDGKRFFGYSGRRMPANRPRGGPIILSAKIFLLFDNRQRPLQRRGILSKMNKLQLPLCRVFTLQICHQLFLQVAHHVALNRS